MPGCGASAAGGLSSCERISVAPRSAAAPPTGGRGVPRGWWWSAATRGRSGRLAARRAGRAGGGGRGGGGGRPTLGGRLTPRRSRQVGQRATSLRRRARRRRHGRWRALAAGPCQLREPGGWGGRPRRARRAARAAMARRAGAGRDGRVAPPPSAQLAARVGVGGWPFGRKRAEASAGVARRAAAPAGCAGGVRASLPPDAAGCSGLVRVSDARARGRRLIFGGGEIGGGGKPPSSIFRMVIFIEGCLILYLT